MRKVGQTKTHQKAPQHRTPEEKFQREVVQALRLGLPGAVVVHAANERTASKEMGMVPGYPDLMVHWRGHTFGVECKAKGRKLRDEQVECAKRLHENYIAVIVVEEADDRSAIEMLVKTTREFSATPTPADIEFRDALDRALPDHTVARG